MKTITRALLAFAALIAIQLPAQAAHRDGWSHVTQYCGPHGVRVCDFSPPQQQAIHYRHNSRRAEAVPSSRRTHHSRIVEDVKFIPNPPGTWRVHRSCAHRLAAFWGLGRGLDSVSTWPRVFARAYGPGVGIAAVRRDLHHVMGIIGGSAGSWRVADFNSGGHLNREYVVSDFSGYFFVDTGQRVSRISTRAPRHHRYSRRHGHMSHVAAAMTR